MKNWQAIVFISVITGLVVLIDCGLGYAFKRQSDSGHFTKTTGVIESSGFSGYTAKHGHNDAKISYGYSVDGIRYESKRYRFLVFYTGDTAAEIVSQFPGGSKADVFYDPHDPGEAVLSAGTSPADVFMVKVLLTVNCVVVALWVWGGKYFPKGKG